MRLKHTIQTAQHTVVVARRNTDEPSVRLVKMLLPTLLIRPDERGEIAGFWFTVERDVNDDTCLIAEIGYKDVDHVASPLIRMSVWPPDVGDEESDGDEVAKLVADASGLMQLLHSASSIANMATSYDADYVDIIQVCADFQRAIAWAWLDRIL